MGIRGLSIRTAFFVLVYSVFGRSEAEKRQSETNAVRRGDENG